MFDLDGTLVDSMPLVLKAFAHAVAPFCGPVSDEELFTRLGGPPERTFAGWLRGAAETAQAMTRLRDYSLTHWKLIRPFDGWESLFQTLRQRELAMAVWTGRERESAQWLFSEYAIAPYLRACVCGDDLPSHKPDPEGLQRIVDELQLTADDALFVGDADVDVLAGHACGVRTLLIRHGRAVDEAVLRKAWRVVETPAEAYAQILQDTNGL
ncbi:HAD family hydrolase [Horticoccus luteus]|uniref:phosphoglycolate phosphatase n=1 Tax=Horticoccus luteus TaxID=2862869 RepID=A0A8F9XIN0_9BACT|nr:HAD-IA family hydrolase [Horticoccus luteus]QYM80575.1 HAD family hydrolase [Horticoccus luteus]